MESSMTLSMRWFLLHCPLHRRTVAFPATCLDFTPLRSHHHLGRKWDSKSRGNHRHQGHFLLTTWNPPQNLSISDICQNIRKKLCPMFTIGASECHSNTLAFLMLMPYWPINRASWDTLPESYIGEAAKIYFPMTKPGQNNYDSRCLL